MTDSPPLGEERCSCWQCRSHDEHAGRRAAAQGPEQARDSGGLREALEYVERHAIDADDAISVLTNAIRAALAADPAPAGLDENALFADWPDEDVHYEYEDTPEREPILFVRWDHMWSRIIARLQPATPEEVAPIHSPAGLRVTIAAGTSVDGVIGPAATPEEVAGEEHAEGWPHTCPTCSRAFVATPAPTTERKDTPPGMIADTLRTETP